MVNVRVPLEPGTRLTKELVIERLISDVGGSSLAYLANRYSREGILEGKVVIKEYYPNESRISLKRSGNKVLALRDDEELNKKAALSIDKSFREEYHKSTELSFSGGSNSVFHFPVSDINNDLDDSFSGTLARYLAINTVDGLSLSDIVKKYGELSLQTSLQLIRKILIPLNLMHQKGILHLDIKEDNLFFPECDEDKLKLTGTFCVILDCGSAKKINAVDTEGFISCTEGYAAPEIIRICDPGDADEEILDRYRRLLSPATDLYSVGMIAYRLIMGKGIDNKIWYSIINEDDPEEKAALINDSIKQRLIKKYPYVYERICDILVRLLYTMPSIDPDYPDDFIRYGKTGNREACEILDDEISLVLDIIEAKGYHPEVLAQLSRDRYKNILLNNNITDEKYFDFNETPFVENWFAGVSEA